MRIFPIYGEAFKMSFTALINNKLRSALSVLGITIGIFCVVSVYALVHSLEKSLNNQFSKYGSDVLFIQKWSWDDFGENYPWWNFLKRPESSPEEADFLARRLDPNLVSSIAFSYNFNRDISAGKEAVKSATVRSVSHDYNQVQDVPISEGRYFSGDESSAGRSVVILGNDIARSLFPNSSALGKQIRIGSSVATVVGVCEYQGSNMMGSSVDDAVYVPSKWALGIVPYRFSQEVQIMVKSAPGIGKLDDLKIEVNRLMRQYRKLKPNQENNFSVNQMTMITDAISGMFSQIQKIGIVIGGFAMLVGSFGVANIMFVSVRERTREIGIQKSLGAKNWFIRTQFLLESVWLSIAGGVIGLVFVWLLLKVLDIFAKQSMGNGVELSLGLEDIYMGVVTSFVVGLLAGFLPAQSAARMSPVEAMRSV
jgi:putative ABC transport system permease protein